MKNFKTVEERMQYEKSIEEKVLLELNESRAELNKTFQKVLDMNLKLTVPKFVPRFYL